MGFRAGVGVSEAGMGGRGTSSRCWGGGKKRSSCQSQSEVRSEQIPSRARVMRLAHEKSPRRCCRLTMWQALTTGKGHLQEEKTLGHQR